MKTIKQDIKSKNLKKCYLLYGSESYLKDIYAKKIKDTIISPDFEDMNYMYVSDKKISVQEISDFMQTLPFLADKKMVFLKDTGLFKSGKKNESEAMAEILENIPDSVCIVFSETEIDKRGKLFKSVQKNGYASEMKLTSETEMIKWIVNGFKVNGIEADKNIAVYLMRNAGSDMENLKNEINKISAFKGNSGKAERKDIDAVCTKTVESNIFDLVSSVGRGNTEKAISIYRNLMNLKERPESVLFLITRQFKLMLECKTLSAEGLSSLDISSKLSEKEFVIKECLRQAAHLSVEVLKNALQECINCEADIKLGRMEKELGIELLIVKLSNN